jgi:hypothetical protein
MWVSSASGCEIAGTGMHACQRISWSKRSMLWNAQRAVAPTLLTGSLRSAVAEMGALHSAQVRPGGEQPAGPGSRRLHLPPRHARDLPAPPHLPVRSRPLHACPHCCAGALHFCRRCRPAPCMHAPTAAPGALHLPRLTSQCARPPACMPPLLHLGPRTGAGSPPGACAPLHACLTAVPGTQRLCLRRTKLLLGEQGGCALGGLTVPGLPYSSIDDPTARL